MGAVKESLYDEIDRIARNTGEAEWEVRQQWENVRRKGMTFEEFFRRKARKKHLLP